MTGSQKSSGYGSNYQQEGKSKFYNDEGEDLPEEDREGHSKFYRQHALDTTSPDKEGFSKIFTNGIGDHDVDKW